MQALPRAAGVRLYGMYKNKSCQAGRKVCVWRCGGQQPGAVGHFWSPLRSKKLVRSRKIGQGQKVLVKDKVTTYSTLYTVIGIHLAS